jgi:hypothetical protein
VATKTRNPTSEVAVTGTWSGTNRHLLLDDHPDSGNPIADGTTCSAVGALVMGFSAFDVPAGATSLSVQVIYYDFKNGSPTAAAGSLIRCNDTTNRNSASTHNQGNGNAAIALRTDTWATNPKSGAAWTIDEVNGVGTNGLTGLGLRVTDASPTGTFSSAIVQVTYTPPITGSLVASEGADTPAFNGVVLDEIAGFLAATEAIDAAALEGDIIVAGALSVTEVSDSLTASGTISSGEIIGTLSAIEAADLASLAGTITVSGVLGVAETPDAAALMGTVVVIGTFSSTEISDSLTAAGLVLVAGNLAATEAQDTFSATGSVGNGSITGAMAWIEGVDTLALQAALLVAGILGGIEGQDFASLLGPQGTLERGASNSLAIVPWDRKADPLDPKREVDNVDAVSSTVTTIDPERTVEMTMASREATEV